MRATLTLRTELSELSRLSAFASEFAERGRLPADDLSRLLVILDELFSNIVRYGYESPHPAGTVAVTLSLNGDTLGIEISDDGRPFDPLASQPPNLDAPTDERPVGGLGIHMVRKLVDEARYVREGNRNRLMLTRLIARPA